MKLTILRGIANNLISHLGREIWFGYFKDLSFPIDVAVLEANDGLSRMCTAFFKERLPPSFDFNRIKAINLKISKSEDLLKIAISLKVDERELVVKGGSIMNG